MALTLQRAAGAVLTVAMISGAAAQDDFAPPSTPVQSEISDAGIELAVLPTYPARAKKHGIDGEVTVRFTITRYGRAVDPEIVSEKPRKVFRSTTLDALRFWNFKPARASVCSTRRQQAEQTFRFRHAEDPQVQLLPIVLEGKAAAIVGPADDEPRGGVSRIVEPDALLAAHRVQPEYPEKALQRRREGFVMLSFFIEIDGRVSEPKVEEAKNGALFNRAALKAIRQWRFEPHFKNGFPVERLGCHEFLFNLDALAKSTQQKRINERTRKEVF